ncbi:unnamed protein product [Acanthocheilonema viteae]|uniref:Uncharacterized protein n=1 Tax=Acanthocheilonema viteae TaxID=6277 RepID=A0A498SS77_ACAVI|nr:unnamed protein product [Acanthocheilonema viteae]
MSKSSFSQDEILQLYELQSTSMPKVLTRFERIVGFGESNGPPERTFRVVMCGDAAAGKSSFRSLCKSYFRRADAAILVYDCTVESSFLNVRDWIATIKAVGVLFAECSALNGINVEGALMNLIRELVAAEDVKIIETGVIIMSKFSKKTSNLCCLRS